jgi:glucose/mannose-6-phosphate isomerase
MGAMSQVRLTDVFVCMRSRLQRYNAFIENEFIEGLLKADEYSITEVQPQLRKAIARGINRIVFTGMGCSAIVSEVLRGCLLDTDDRIEIVIVNDYDLTAILTPAQLADPHTLFVISSYSGHSTEPILAFEQLTGRLDRVLLLTSGGRLAERGRELGGSIALWQLSRPDREYPLFHVTQYFAILLRVFAELGLLAPGEGTDVVGLAQTLSDERACSREHGRRLAAGAVGANVLMIAQPRWHDALLKLCKMHLNEIAMVPAGRNYFHEFCHSEVATLSDPERRHCVVMLADQSDDDYTREKRERLYGLLTSDIPQNRTVSAYVLPMRGSSFAERLFTTLDAFQFMTAELTHMRETRSRDLISEAAGNSWYHSTTIAGELELAGMAL